MGLTKNPVGFSKSLWGARCFFFVFQIFCGGFVGIKNVLNRFKFFSEHFVGPRGCTKTFVGLPLGNPKTPGTLGGLKYMLGKPGDGQSHRAPPTPSPQGSKKYLPRGKIKKPPTASFQTYMAGSFDTVCLLAGVHPLSRRSSCSITQELML